ncbi:MAG: penicillin-binding transpeptidase domain-containing protein [Lachnospiraceae bacterium]
MAKKKKKPTIFSQTMKKKLAVFFIILVFLMVVLIIRLFYIQNVKGDEYKKQVLKQQGYESQTIPYQRGDITDAKGTILATSVDVYNVILDCVLINEDKDYIEPTVAALLQCFPEITEEEIRTAITERADSRYFILRKKLPYEEVQPFVALQEAIYTEGKKKGSKVNPKIQGVWFEKEYVRKYPYSTFASKIVGFTASGNKGIGGLEDYYNDTLNGINGRQYGYLNADNNFEKTIKDAVNGQTLVTSIDMNIQSVVEQKIEAFQQLHANEATPGAGSLNTAVMVVNPQNGELLAMADSTPFDLNNPRDLTRYCSPEEIAAMDEKTQLDRLNAIWQNFCLTYTFEPGSTAKPFTVAAGLDTGKLKGDETYVCDGVEKVGGHDIHCVKRSGHGVETIEQSIMNSCNDALMQIVAQIGKEEFCKYQNIFNFGLKTNIDLPGEARTDTVIRSLEEMGNADLATNAFGQNFNVTMVQLASAFSSLINGGYYYQPHLVKKIIDDNGNTVKTMEPTVLKQTISKQTSDMIKGYLYNTVSTGTAKSAKVEGYSMGGKTGTAQKFPRGNKKYLVSFIGFVPVENPQVLVYVVINEPNVQNQAQSSLATNMAKEIFTDILPYLNIFKDEAVPPAAPENGGTPAVDAGTPAEPAITPETPSAPAENATPETPPTPPAPEEVAAAQEDYSGDIFE